MSAWAAKKKKGVYLVKTRIGEPVWQAMSHEII